MEPLIARCHVSNVSSTDQQPNTLTVHNRASLIKFTFSFISVFIFMHTKASLKTFFISSDASPCGVLSLFTTIVQHHVTTFPTRRILQFHTESPTVYGGHTALSLSTREVDQIAQLATVPINRLLSRA